MLLSTIYEQLQDGSSSSSDDNWSSVTLTLLPVISSIEFSVFGVDRKVKL